MDTQFIRRGASALGAAALGIMVLAGPALASQDPGDGGGQAATMTSQASKNAADLRDLRQQQGRLPAALPNPRFIPVDDNAIEYVQVSLGALGGIALAGAAAAGISRRNHHHPAAHPA